MKTLPNVLALIVVLCVILLLPMRVSAELVRVVHQFTDDVSGYSEGGNLPSTKLVSGPDGFFYGVARTGGKNGSGLLFKMTPAGQTTTLHEFGNDFPAPSAGFITEATLIAGRDGNLYGTAYVPAAQTGTGFIFRMTTTGDFTILHTFGDGSIPQDGKKPNCLIQAQDGNFYGTASTGSLSGGGEDTIFKMTPTGTVTILRRLTTAAEGFVPFTLVEGVNGIFYGATSSGGSTVPGDSYGYGYGTLFKITAAGAFTTLHNFGDGTVLKDGTSPKKLMLAADGNLYGTTVFGGAQPFGQSFSGTGIVFKITPAGVFSVVHAFGDGAPLLDGANPVDLLQAADGTFYGTTLSGGYSGSGTVYRLTPAGVLTLIFDFSAPGAYPYSESPGGLTLSADGKLYGITARRDVGDNFNQTAPGTAYQLTLQGALTQLHRFGTSLIFPGGLTVGTDGNLYGRYAGTSGGENGAIFKSTPTGNLTILHVFGDGSITDDGKGPSSDLVQSSDGDFYGTTLTGVSDFFGTFYKITPTGVVTILHDFQGFDANEVSYPTTSLTLGTDGNFYGTTPGGGQYHMGSVYKITPTGTVTTMYSFGSSTVGESPAYPQVGLTRGADGNFYGTTLQSNYDSGTGFVYKITPTGILTKLYAFAQTDGIPFSGLVQAGNGLLYGMTSSKIYRISTSGSLTFLWDSTHATPAFAPFEDHDARLLLGADGNLYGVNTPLSIGVGGMFFAMTPAGQFTILHTFGESDGMEGFRPHPKLVQDKHGAIYGTTYRSIDYGGGTIFVAKPLNAKITQTITFPAPANPYAGGTFGLAAYASSNLPVSYTVTGPATITNGALVVTGPGTVKVTASQTGDDFYSAAPPVTVSLVIGKTPQTIAFPAVTDRPFGVKYTLEGTTSSGLPITYTVLSGPAVLSGKQLTFTGVGTVTVKATQVGNSTYAAAQEVTSTVTAVKGPQTIAFPGIAKQTWPVSTITLGATASSGLPITYAVSGFATLSGNTLTITKPGTVNVTARQKGNANYLAAPQVTIQFNVAKTPQTLTFPTVGVVQVGQTVTLGAMASSGLPVAYTASTGTATISGNMVTFTAKGTVKLTATQPGNETIAAARAVSLNISVR